MPPGRRAPSGPLPCSGLVFVRSRLVGRVLIAVLVAALAAVLAVGPRPGLAGTSPYPAGYGPAADRLFSPFRIPAEALHEPLYLVLNVAACRLYVYRDGSLVRTYPTTVGRPGEPTPLGRFWIISKRVNPTWYPPDRPPVPPGPSNPLGTRWMGFTWWGHGFHGTNTPWLIGRPGSAGCVRLYNEDAEELFEMVRIGTPGVGLYEPVELADHGPEAGLVLGLHLDIYSRAGDYGAFVADRLALAGRELPPEVLEALVEAVFRYRAVVWDTVSPVTLDGRPLASDIVSVGQPPDDDEPRVWVRAFGEHLGLPVGWDAAGGRPTLAGRPVPGCAFVGGRAYARIGDLAEAAGIPLDWTFQVSLPAAGEDLVRRALAITRPFAVYVDGMPLAARALRLESGLHLPVRAVAAALGLPVHWDAERRAVLVAGCEVAASVVDGASYLLLDDFLAFLEGRLAVSVTVTENGVFIRR
ncbi:MAG: L,D-transpeptidase family protein [Bacillota bacterium]